MVQFPTVRRCILRFALLLHVLLLAACSGPAGALPPVFTAMVEQSDAVQCSEDAQVSCELSAVVWIKGQGQSGEGGRLIFGNDKPPRSALESSVFAMGFDGGAFRADGAKTFYTHAPFANLGKLESMSITPDGRHVVAMTAFDRYHADEAEMDRFNVLLTWPAQHPQIAKVVSASERQGIESSRTLRAGLLRAISKNYGQQANYFKVEGLALLPQGRVLFGIREIGTSFQAFDYGVILVEGAYAIRNGEWVMDETRELRVVADFTNATRVVGRKLGLSSIEYDARRQLLYVLTSFEDTAAKEIGAFLWVLPDENGTLGSTLQLVRTPQGDPFAFANKAEGLAVLEDGRIFIVHDDDRHPSMVHENGLPGGPMRARKPNEAAFDILRIDGPGPAPHAD